jgi:quinol monooxygenase YgiN
MQAKTVTVLIRAKFPPDSVEEGRRDLLNLAQEVRKVEVDCHAIEIAQDLDDLTSVTMIEKWSSREAYEGPHMQTPHMQSFLEQSSQYFAGPPDITFCHGTRIGEE